MSIKFFQLKKFILLSLFLLISISTVNADAGSITLVQASNGLFCPLGTSGTSAYPNCWVEYELISNNPPCDTSVTVKLTPKPKLSTHIECSSEYGWTFSYSVFPKPHPGTNQYSFDRYPPNKRFPPSAPWPGGTWSGGPTQSIVIDDVPTYCDGGTCSADSMFYNYVGITPGFTCKLKPEYDNCSDEFKNDPNAQCHWNSIVFQPSYDATPKIKFANPWFSVKPIQIDIPKTQFDSTIEVKNCAPKDLTDFYAIADPRIPGGPGFTPFPASIVGTGSKDSHIATIPKQTDFSLTLRSNPGDSTNALQWFTPRMFFEFEGRKILDYAGNDVGIKHLGQSAEQYSINEQVYPVPPMSEPTNGIKMIPLSCSLTCSSDGSCNSACATTGGCIADPDCGSSCSLNCSANSSCNYSCATTTGCIADPDCVSSCSLNCASNGICNINCAITSGCVVDPDCASTCGNGTINSGEVCDGSLLNGETCSTKGFSDGTLKCSSNCSGFDTSSCTGSSCSLDCASNGTCNSACATASGCFVDPDCESCSLNCASNGICNINCATAVGCSADPDCSGTCPETPCIDGFVCVNGFCEVECTDCEAGKKICGSQPGVGGCVVSLSISGPCSNSSSGSIDTIYQYGQGPTKVCKAADPSGLCCTLSNRLTKGNHTISTSASGIDLYTGQSSSASLNSTLNCTGTGQSCGCNNGTIVDCNTEQPGVCADGTRTCSSGEWGSCIPKNSAGIEVCENGLDDDCDGTVDNCSSICTVDCSYNGICNTNCAANSNCSSDPDCCVSDGKNYNLHVVADNGLNVSDVQVPSCTWKNIFTLLQVGKTHFVDWDSACMTIDRFANETKIFIGNQNCDALAEYGNLPVCETNLASQTDLTWNCTPAQNLCTIDSGGVVLNSTGTNNTSFSSSEIQLPMGKYLFSATILKSAENIDKICLTDLVDGTQIKCFNDSAKTIASFSETIELTKSNTIAQIEITHKGASPSTFKDIGLYSFSCTCPAKVTCSINGLDAGNKWNLYPLQGAALPLTINAMGVFESDLAGYTVNIKNKPSFIPTTPTITIVPK